MLPYYRLREEGIKVDIASINEGNIKGEDSYQIEVDNTLQGMNSDEYDTHILPGGRAPEALKKEKKAVEMVKEFFQKNKPISAICHGPHLLTAAGVLEGKHVTSYRSVAGEMRDAGVIYEDKEVVVDGNLVISRQRNTETKPSLYRSSIDNQLQKAINSVIIQTNLLLCRLSSQ